MPEQLTPEHIELRTTCLHLVEQLGEHASTEAVRSAAKTAGLFGMTQPREFGGTAASQLELTVARETLASCNVPWMGAVFGSGPGVLSEVEEPLRTSHLLPMLAGDKRGSFGFTEADADRPTTGKIEAQTLVVNGHKSYVTGGADADFINTLVKIEGAGPSMVVIDTHTPGVRLKEKFSSLDGSHHAYFVFENVEVPIGHVIGEPGAGMPKAMRQIGDTRLLLAATASGYMLWIIDLLQNHLQQKDKAGNPRGDQLATRLRYGELRVKAFAARSMLYRTARMADSGMNVVNEAMACKIFATEAVGELTDAAIQLVGGTALMDTHPLTRLYKTVRAWRLAEGATDTLYLNIGRGALELGKGTL